ncbi:hypothetical protein PV396_12960 [Streptomyces sp. ME02-8801-2C]|uniref:hypothetical protein n=1 Tax=Streptomyces sp. ME02-8801-2C TaxID=3028680 RepID=UPI0029BBAD8F|nr:hypothetical protein [Streptomyces sp. ME02-8801-2C]MDX3452849.1 hypothetical protein [Streptomyces sp. ME02-8801-2C]
MSTSLKLVTRLSPRLIAGPGLLVGAGGMLWFAGLEPDSSYAGHLLPAMFVTAVGLGNTGKQEHTEGTAPVHMG